MSDSDYQYYGRGADDQYADGEIEEAYEAALRPFWAAMKHEVSACGSDLAEYKNQQLPLARIKKIMKSDEDVRMISAEAPVLFAKACEMFILDLTIRGWVHAEDSRRRTLQRSDIAACIAQCDVLDFLADIIPVEEEGVSDGAAAGGAAGGAAASPAAAAAAAGAEQQQSAPAMYYSQWSAEGQQQHGGS